jgi:hypothetical protein
VRCFIQYLAINGPNHKRFRHLANVARYAPCLIQRQHFGYVSISFCLAPINISEAKVLTIFL